MMRAKVVGAHHKQKQSILDWMGGYDGDVAKQAIDDLVTAPEGPLYEKGRGTVTLTSIADAKDFIKKHDEDEEFTWYLDRG